ncbi:hypothetical protein [Flavobacterium sp.]|uniref:hypothetical protein n=1 Tax=Flavobacterium sp. TaxID=239 RepID=UPI0028BF0FB6|nr:hypothetical protein [Flavobacterium sp.]
MKNVINKKQLVVYDKYDGDADGLLRINNLSDIEVFENQIDTIWSFIANKLQDIKLINERLCSKEYSINTLKDLKGNCDTEVYEIFMSKIKKYQSFKEISKLLKTVKGKISSETDVVWTGFDKPEILITKINLDIEKIEFCDYETLEKVKVDFLPTCTYQELSLSNGWAEEYLEIASKFDLQYSIITEEKNNIVGGKKWWEFW